MVLAVMCERRVPAAFVCIRDVSSSPVSNEISYDRRLQILPDLLQILEDSCTGCVQNRP